MGTYYQKGGEFISPFGGEFIVTLTPARFNTDEFGAYYASKELITAVKETAYHKERFYRYNNAPSGTYYYRVYNAEIHGDFFFDITDKDHFAEFYTDDYTKTQKLGIRAKKENKDGIIYKSARHTEGINVAVLKPKVVRNCKIDRTLIYFWDGEKITVSEVGSRIV